MKVFVVLAVALLLIFLAYVIPSNFANRYDFTGTYLIGFEADEGVFTFVRLFLIIMEAIWLMFWAVFYFKVAKDATGEKDETTHAKVTNFEKYYFWGVATFLLFLVIASFVVPYAFYGDKLTHFHAPDEPDSITVYVKGTDGFQWKFDTNGDGQYDDDPNNFFIRGQKYRLVVSAESFSHGLGIYSPDGVMRGQTNINPGYEAVLYHTFEQSGTYTFLCMEYCGIGHHNMKTDVIVGGS